MPEPRTVPPSAVRNQDGALVFSYGGRDLDDPVSITNIAVASGLTADGISDATTLGRSIIRNVNPTSIRSDIGAEASANKGKPNGHVPLTSYGEVESYYAAELVDDAIGEAITFALFKLGA